MRNAAAAFRRVLSAQAGPLIIPGVFNALWARVVEDAGFPCLYMSGFAVSTTLLGRPDLGMVGLGEMAETARRITSAVDVPVLADADTGYGGVFSIRRTVEEYERAGLAGMHIEDQDLTVKRCGHLSEIKVIQIEAMCQRLRAALRARRDDDFFIIGRTDARRPLGFDEALRRAKLYASEGVDAIMVEYLNDTDEIRRIVDAVKVPVVLVVVEGPQMLSPDVIRETGVRIVLYPISTLQAGLAAAEQVASVLQKTGSTRAVLDRMVDPAHLRQYIRFDDMAKWETRLESNLDEGGHT